MESCSSPPSNSLFHLSPIFLFTSLFLLSLIILSFSLYKRFFKTHNHHPKTPPSHNSPSEPDPNSPTHLTKSVLFQVPPSDPDSVLENSEVKKKKRKAKKKKRMNLETEECANTGWDWGFKLKPDCFNSFISSSSVLQRKIKHQYDELVKINDSKKLTLPQVLQFGNSLIDARKELQHKADADRSSFDRLHQQIYKLELEQKRLEEDAFVYNSLQYQLKQSPAYQKMLELGAGMENAKKCEPGENIDDEFSDISFEELLAQEKKDSFWQKNGKSRMCSS
ncbi:hypothetical protein P8452_58292 [Trifolium repens]|nr:hypothetical protein P8452_58292 [Trifolium repens]